MADFATNFLAGHMGARNQMRDDQQQANQNALMPLRMEALELGNQQTRQSMSIAQERLEMARTQAAQAAAATEDKAGLAQDLLDQRRALATVAGSARDGQIDPQMWNMTLAGFGMQPGALPPTADGLALLEATLDGIEEGAFSGAVRGPEPDFVTLNDQLVNRAAPGGPAVVPVQGMQPDQPDPTSAMREYEMAQAQGFEGSFLDYRRALAEAGKPETNIYNDRTQAGEPPTVPQEDVDALSSSLKPSDYRYAFGAFDAVTGTAGNVIDSVTGQNLRPIQQAATTEIQDANTQFMLVGSASLPGRPSNLTRERIESMTPRPGVMGEGRAANKATAVARYLAQEINAVNEMLRNPNISAADKSQLSRFVTQARPLFEFYRNLSEGLAVPADGDEDDDALIQKYLNP